MAPLPHHGRACAFVCLSRVPQGTGTPGGQLPFLLASASRQHSAQGLGEPSASPSDPPPCVLAQRKPAGESTGPGARPAGGKVPKRTEPLPGNLATQGPVDDCEVVVRALPVCVLEARLPIVSILVLSF